MGRRGPARGCLIAAALACFAGACATPQSVERDRAQATSVAAAGTATAAASVPTQVPQSATIPVGPGHLVSVGQHRLYVECAGSGSPTVVLDAGADPHRRAWQRVLDGVKSFTRICIYDRAGTGASENAPVPRTSEQVVHELRALFANAGITRPVVLAGHGIGGLNVRLHASLYPGDVAGLVLLNPFEEDSFLQYVARLTPEQVAGYVRLTTAMGEGLDPVASTLQMVAAPPLRARPGVIVAPRRGIPAEVHDYLMALAERVPGSRVVFADNSGQYIHLDQPDVAVAAVRDVVTAVRDGG